MAKPKLKPPVGSRFGRLVVEAGETRSERGIRAFPCRCDCGAAKVVVVSDLYSGRVVSCGCAKREASARTGRANFKHGGVKGGRRSPTYITWQSMLLRCENQKTNGYAIYGGRGIKVCPAWRDFGTFLADMGERPEGMTLDRIDVDGDYCPSNCRWVSDSVQYSNKRTSRTLTHEGVTLTVAEWARVQGLHRNTILRRLNKGASPPDALRN